MRQIALRSLTSPVIILAVDELDGRFGHVRLEECGRGDGGHRSIVGLLQKTLERNQCLIEAVARRQFMAARLVQLAGTCAGGFVLTRQEAVGKWGKATYSLVRTAKAAQTGA